MRRFCAALLIGSALVPASAIAGSNPKRGESIGYFLPKTEVEIVVSQLITACPNDEDTVEVDTEITIEPVAVPDEYVAVDIRSGLFAERSTKLELRPNGTLESFNAETEGQGGKILGAISKAAFTVAGFGAGPEMLVNAYKATYFNFGEIKPEDVAQDQPAPEPLVCNKATVEALAAIDARVADIKAIEKRIVETGGTAADVALLERRRNQVANIKNGLTLKSVATVDPAKSEYHLDSVDYLEWFAANANLPAALKNKAVLGAYGFAVKYTLDASASRPAFSGDGTVNDRPRASLIYKRPVPVEVLVAPCASEAQKKENENGTISLKKQCDVDASKPAKAIYASDVVPVPQLSKLFSLRIGRGGLFGSKQASAKFDEFGTPLELEYGTSTGTDGAVDVINGSTDGVVSVRDAKLAELERQIAIEKARADLAKLRAGTADEDEE